MSAELRRAAQRMIDFQRQKQDGAKKQKVRIYELYVVDINADAVIICALYH